MAAWRVPAVTAVCDQGTELAGVEPQDADVLRFVKQWPLSRRAESAAVVQEPPPFLTAIGEGSPLPYHEQARVGGLRRGQTGSFRPSTRIHHRDWGHRRDRSVRRPTPPLSSACFRRRNRSICRQVRRRGRRRPPSAVSESPVTGRAAEIELRDALMFEHVNEVCAVGSNRDRRLSMSQRHGPRACEWPFLGQAELQPFHSRALGTLAFQGAVNSRHHRDCDRRNAGQRPGTFGRIVRRVVIGVGASLDLNPASAMSWRRRSAFFSRHWRSSFTTSAGVSAAASSNPAPRSVQRRECPRSSRR